MQAIILAGGKGTRLKPFTTCIPKPLVPVGDMPILEIVIRQLKHHGITNIVIAVNHLAEIIMAFFGDGKKYGVDIQYSIEDKPMGTAGPLTLIDKLDDSFLVMNGDLLTTINYQELWAFHNAHSSMATIATFKKHVAIDLGVLKIHNELFVDYIEKPTYVYDVSMGIYIFQKEVLQYLPKDQSTNMPDLMLLLHKEQKKVTCFKGDYDWLDIGRVDDYQAANDYFETNRKALLHE